MPTTVERNPELDEELAGLDNLELPVRRRTDVARRLWSATWPKVAAVALALFLWQCVVWSGWKPEFVLPAPGPVFERLWDDLTNGKLPEAIALTMRRAFVGYTVALILGVVIGALVSRIKVLRTAVGSMITGLQTMPSIAWFPLALILFGITEQAIYFVVVLGAAPAIANGLITGADNIQPILLRAGRVLGARRLTLYRHVVLPASLPSFVGGLKQGWAFSWRSLMAGELLVVIPGQFSIGFLLQEARNFSNTQWLLSTMIVILIIGIMVDSLLFGTMERAIRKRWGLIDPAS